MLKTGSSCCLVLVGVAIAFTCPLVAANTIEAKSAGTLILLGFTRDAIVMAADSGEFFNGNLKRANVRKIKPVGKFGVIGMSGISMLEGGNTKIDFGNIVQHCATKNADIESAATCLTKDISDALPGSVQVTNPDGDILVGLYLAGYVNGIRTLIVLQFSIDHNTRLIKREPNRNSISPEAGFVIGFGQTGFALKVLHGDVPELQNDPAMEKFRLREQNKTRDEYTVAEMKTLLSMLLKTTESELGRRDDEGAKFVVPPNIVFVVDSRRGSYRIPAL